ncbi:MAG TPA: hypothetical protein VHH35_20910 [Pyrinomonadaceae bacterium]|nr:hypothetical protein [Pyrinomonadaceae bacterium]
MPSFQFTKSLLVILAILVCVTTGLSQQPAQANKKPAQKDPKAQPTKPGAKLPYTLTVKTRPILNISLKAEKANIADVTQELSKKINAPIFLGTERQKEPLSIEFSELTLEPALQLLSPTVYVDYEIDTGSQAPPRVLGIFLYDANQGEPPLTAVVHGSSQSILIEGNTEDGVATEGGEKKEEPLRVTYENHLLSVKARKQPLSLIILKIGETIGIPVDVQDDRMEPVDAEISKLPVEDAVRQLGPNIKMFVRADLTRAERRALRLVLSRPPSQTQ